MQRRHQKLLEETPSPAFNPEMRARFAEASCAIARHVGYRSAGTVEFILDEQGQFYFLEVNTRLQVEHPVTEMVTGLDLVALQIAIAEGAPLPFRDPPTPRGWSMEARIIAEDARRNFIPSIGRIERVRFPAGPGVRNDAGFYRGYQVPVYYDSLLSKLVVWGADREQARCRMLRALHEYVLEGVANNIEFHRWLVAHPEFAAGHLTTRFIEEHFKPAMLDPTPEQLEVALVAAALHAHDERLRVTLPDERDARDRAAWRFSDRDRDRRRGARK